jgi:hypothetical protein
MSLKSSAQSGDLPVRFSITLWPLILTEKTRLPADSFFVSANSNVTIRTVRDIEFSQSAPQALFDERVIGSLENIFVARVE